MRDRRVTVVGAGPSGLACAIVLARSGIAVTVHEARARVGARFSGDFQGIENWSSEIDALGELASFGIEATFDYVPIHRGIAFDDRNTRYELRSAAPLFYLVRRGSESGSLDTSLYEQAVEAGVDVRFNDRLESIDPQQNGVIAAGPRRAYGIAAGFVFKTAMPDGCYIRLDDALAPGGYAYLVIQDGRGTVASCLFRDFGNQRGYVERTIGAFERDPGLNMEDPRHFGGFGSFFLRRSAYQGWHAVTGEHAGLQDALLGFGMRWAMQSGIWAARAQIGLEDLEHRWRSYVRRRLEASLVNRFLFERIGDSGRRWILRWLANSADLRASLRRIYQGSLLTQLLAPVAILADGRRLRDPSCAHRDCSCVWCRER